MTPEELREAKELAVRPTVGERIARWTTSCFGPHAMARKERAARLAEEAVELAQAEGVGRELIDGIVRRAFSCPPGEPSQEGGGVGLCFEAWAHAAGENIQAITLRELERVEGFSPEHFRERHAAKIAAGSAEAPASSPLAVPVEDLEALAARWGQVARAHLEEPRGCSERDRRHSMTLRGCAEDLRALIARGKEPSHD